MKLEALIISRVFFMIAVVLLLLLFLAPGASAPLCAFPGAGPAQDAGAATPACEPAAALNVTDLESRGDLLRQEKRYAEALGCYRQALGKDERNPVLLNKAGIAQLQLGQLPSAEKYFKNAVKRNGQYAEAYNNLGVIAYMNRNYGKAVKQYRRAVELRESSAAFHSNLATAYFSQQKMLEAVAEYSRAVQLDPDILLRSSAGGVAAQIASPEDRAQFWYVLAKTYAQRGDVERCLRCLEKAHDEGYGRMQDVNKDPEFVAVRQDPRIVELLSQHQE